MNAQSRTPICDRCSHPITGRVQTVPTFSASGARPDATYHETRAECGTPPLGAPDVLGRARRAR